MSFHYLTADHIHWNRWTRKHRLKFRKRWRRQHNGQKFTWLMLEYRHAFIAFHQPNPQRVILHRREPSQDEDKFSPFIKT